MKLGEKPELKGVGFLEKGIGFFKKLIGDTKSNVDAVLSGDRNIENADSYCDRSGEIDSEGVKRFESKKTKKKNGLEGVIEYDTFYRKLFNQRYFKTRDTYEIFGEITSKLQESKETGSQLDKKYYLKWLYGQLSVDIDSKKIDEMSDQELDNTIKEVRNKLSKFLFKAVNYTKEYVGLFPSSHQFFLKSKNFKYIHDDIIKTEDWILSLIDLYMEKIEELEGFKKNNRKDGVKSCEKAMFEIQRLFALMQIFIDRERSNAYQDSEKDMMEFSYKLVDFIPKKFWSKEEYSPEEFSDEYKKLDNIFYMFSNTERSYWKKNEDNSYSYSSKLDKENGFTKPLELGHSEITGTLSTGEVVTIPVYDISCRGIKKDFSAAEKLLLNGYDYFDSIEDNKGVRFVVKNEEDIPKLIDLIQNSDFVKKNHKWKEKPVKNKKGDLSFTKGKLNIVMPNRDINVEFQFYTLDNYMRAIVDEDSPAHHGHYKLKKKLDLFFRLFPKRIFFDSVEEVKNMVEFIKENKIKKQED